MKRVNAITLVCATVFALAAGQIAQAQKPSYEVTDLGSLGHFTSTHVFDINNSGQVVGDALNNGLFFHAFVWQDGVMQDLGTSEDTFSRAFTISPGGLIAGWQEDEQGANRAAVWTPGGIRLLPTPKGHIGAEAYAVSDRGIVGGTAIEETRFRRPYAWINGRPHRLAEGEGFVAAISDAQQAAVGRVTIDGFYSAVVWRRSGQSIEMTVLPDLGANHEVAQDININGVIVGTAFNPENSKDHAVVWSDGQIRDLGLFQDVFPTSAGSINDAGEIVGHYFDFIEFENRAMLWQSDGTAHDLNDLIPPGSPWTLMEVKSINNASQIVGWGERVDQTGVRGYLLTPVGD